MPLILSTRSKATSTDIYTTIHEVTGGDFTAATDIRLDVAAFIRNLGTGGGTVTVGIEILDVATGATYGREEVAVAKPPATSGLARRFEPRIPMLLPVGKKARFFLKSSSSSDTAVQYDVYVYNVGYPVVDAEFRDSEPVPSQSAATYASGDVIGAQIAFNVGTNRGSIVACRVLDKSKNSVPLELWLFRASIAPTPSNDWDNDPFPPSDTQLADLAGVIRIDDWFANNENTIGQATNLPLSFTDLTSGNLYAWLISRGAPVYTATSHLTVQLEVLKD